MAEEAKDEAKTIPAAINRVRDRRLRDLLHAAGRRAVGAAGDANATTASTRRSSACPRTRAASPATRSSASSSTIDLGSLQRAGEIYVGLLAATILFIATNAGIIGVSRLVYSMGIHRQVPDRLRQLHPRYGTPWIGILLFGGVALPRDDPGPGRLPRQHVRVRRDAVVHDRAPRGHPPADRPQPDCRAAVHAARATLRVARLRRCRCSRSSAGIGTALAFVVVTALHLDVALAGIGWLALGIALSTSSTAAARGSTCRRRSRSRSRGPVDEPRPSTSRCSSRSTPRNYSPEPIATAAKLAGAAAARHPRARDDHRAARLADRRRAARAGARRRTSVIEQAKHAGRAAGDRPRREGAPGRPGRLIVDEAREMRAQAIVMPLPAADGRDDAVRQDDRDRAGRAPVPRHHPVRAAVVTRSAARAMHRASTLVLSAVMLLLGVAMIVATLVNGRRAARARRPASASCSRSPAAGGCTSRCGGCDGRGAARTRRAPGDVPARPRLTGAVRDRLHVARERDLLLARRRRRPRARADAARLPRRRACSSCWRR